MSARGTSRRERVRVRAPTAMHDERGGGARARGALWRVVLWIYDFCFVYWHKKTTGAVGTTRASRRAARRAKPDEAIEAKYTGRRE